MNSRKQNKKVKGKKWKRPVSLLDRIKAMSIGDAADAAYGAFSAASRLLALNAEMKFVDTSQNGGTVTFAGTVTPISLLAQGLTVSSREGESIRVHGIEARFGASADPTATRNYLRTIVFADMETRGAAPAAADVLENTGNGNSYASPWNHLGGPRFNILYDSGPMAVSTAAGPKAWEVMIPYNEHVHYNGAGGTIASSYEGSLYVLQIADVTALGPSCTLYTRVHYADN